MQHQVLAPVPPPTPVALVVQPLPPVVAPDAGQAEDGLLKQFLSLHAPTFLEAIDKDLTEFLREMDKRFRLMAYNGPRRVKMSEFMLKGLA